MKKFLFFCTLIGCLILLSSSNNFAQIKPWVSDMAFNPPRPISEFTNALVQRVQDLNLTYIPGTGVPGCNASVNVRIRCRNAKVREMFRELRAQRQFEHGAYRRQLVTSEGCSATHGQTKRCWVRVLLPSGTQFLKNTLAQFGDGWRQNPTYASDNSSIGYMIGKAGRGRNYGGFVLQATHSDIMLRTLINGDLQVVRQALERLGLPTDQTPDPIG